MDPIRKAVNNAKIRKLGDLALRGVGYPEDYDQYRKGGQFGDVPGKGNDAQKVEAKRKEPSGGSKGNDQQMHMDPMSYAVSNREMDINEQGMQNSVLTQQMQMGHEAQMQEQTASHEERMALISQGINPDTLQSFEEERLAREEFIEFAPESREDVMNAGGNWGDPEFLSREDLLKQSGSPQYKIGDSGVRGAIGGKKFYSERPEEFHIGE